MIIYTMTEDEILTQVKKVVDAAEAMECGLHRKYEKQLNNRKVPDQAILGVTKYTIDGNTVYMVCSKQLFGRGTRRAEMTSSTFISCMDTNTGKKAFIRPIMDIYGYKVVGYTMFTIHCIERLKERTGEDFETFIKKYGSQPMGFMETGEDGHFQGTIHNCPHKFFGYMYEKSVYVTTIIREDMCREDQKEITDKVVKLSADYFKEKNRVCA